MIPYPDGYVMNSSLNQSGKVCFGLCSGQTMGKVQSALAVANHADSNHSVQIIGIHSLTEAPLDPKSATILEFSTIYNPISSIKYRLG